MKERAPFARKIAELGSRLSVRNIGLPDENGAPSEREALFRTIERHAGIFCDFMNQYACMRLDVDRDLLWITVQSPTCRWWASYVMWLRKNALRNDELVITFIEPTGPELLPFAVTRVESGTIGQLEFAAWAQLDLISQSIARLLGDSAVDGG